MLIKKTAWEYCREKIQSDFDRDTRVDFVVNDLPIEVKFRKFTRPAISRGMASFIKKYKPPETFIVTKNFTGEMQFEGAQVYFIPAFRFKPVELFA